MTKHGICCKTNFLRGLRNRIHSSQEWDGLRFAITLPIETTERKLLIRIPKTSIFPLVLLLSIFYNQTTLLRADQILREMRSHVSFNIQANLCPMELVSTTNDKWLLTKLGKVESRSRGRSYTGARGKGGIGSGVLQASCRMGP